MAVPERICAVLFFAFHMAFLGSACRRHACHLVRSVGGSTCLARRADATRSLTLLLCCREQCPSGRFREGFLELFACNYLTRPRHLRCGKVAESLTEEGGGTDSCFGFRCVLSFQPQVTGSTHQVHHRLAAPGELLNGQFSMTVQMRCGIMECNREHQREANPGTGTPDRLLFDALQKAYQQTLEQETLLLPSYADVRKFRSTACQKLEPLAAKRRHKRAVRLRLGKKGRAKT